MVRTIIMTRICCVRVWFMGRHIYSYSLGNFPRINISYLVSNMITGSVNMQSLNLTTLAERCIRGDLIEVCEEL